MGSTEERWAAVAEHVAEAMTERALSQAELVRTSGVSAYTVRRVMAGNPGNYRADRLAKIARALGWSPDSIGRILEGGEPEVVGQGADAVIAELFRQVDELQGIADRANRTASDALAVAKAANDESRELRAELAAEREARLSSGLARPSTAPRQARDEPA